MIHMLLLYSGASDTEVGPLLLKLQHIFDCLKAALHPFVERTLEDLDDMIDVCCKCICEVGGSNPGHAIHFGKLH